MIHKGNIVLDKNMTELRGSEQIVEVAFDFRVEERMLLQIPHVKSVINIHEFLFNITFDTQKDMRSSIFDFANQNGLKILQINHKHRNLEQLFLELTR